jgi:hypothetical protein
MPLDPAAAAEQRRPTPQGPYPRRHAAQRPNPQHPAAPRAGRRVLAVGAALAAAAAVAAVVFAVTAGLRTADTDEATLRGFQIRVLSISQAAAENRMDGALAALQALESDLDAAARDGRISASRLRGIETALEAVRTDINTQLTPPGDAAASAEVPGTAETGTAGTSAANTAQDLPAQPVSGQPAAVPPPAPAPDNQAPGPADAAKDNGKGKGKDKP